MNTRKTEELFKSVVVSCSLGAAILNEIMVDIPKFVTKNSTKFYWCKWTLQAKDQESDVHLFPKMPRLITLDLPHKALIPKIDV